MLHETPPFHATRLDVEERRIEEKREEAEETRAPEASGPSESPAQSLPSPALPLLFSSITSDSFSSLALMLKAKTYWTIAMIYHPQSRPEQFWGADELSQSNRVKWEETISKMQWPEVIAGLIGLTYNEWWRNRGGVKCAESLCVQSNLATGNEEWAKIPGYMRGRLMAEANEVQQAIMGETEGKQ